MNIKLKTSLIAVALVSAAALVFVGLALAASSTHQGAIDPSSPAITAAEPVGLLGPGKSDQELIEKQRPALSAARRWVRWARPSR